MNPMDGQKCGQEQGEDAARQGQAPGFGEHFKNTPIAAENRRKELPRGAGGHVETPALPASFLRGLCGARAGQRRID